MKLAREVAEDARMRHHTARVQLAETEEAFVLADPARTRQVLENLIDNAVKYAEHGPVRVAVERGDGVVAFGVSDEGPGIPRPPWTGSSRSSIARTQMGGRRGRRRAWSVHLQELVRRMGGRLWMESTQAPGRSSPSSPFLPA